MTEVEQLRQSIEEYYPRITPEVNAFRKGTNNPARNYIKNLYRNRKGLRFPEDIDQEQATSILEYLFLHACDQGLRRKITITHPETGEEESLNPTFMLTRQSGIHFLKKTAGLNYKPERGYELERPFYVGFIDIANLGEANLYQEGRGGDYLIQEVALTINEYIKTLPESVREAFNIMPIRYGGDEFAVIIVPKNEEYDTSNPEDIFNEIQQKITTQTAFYGKKGEERNIQLKESDTLLLSSDPDKLYESIDQQLKETIENLGRDLNLAKKDLQQLWLHYLSLGIILHPDELAKEYLRILENKEIQQFIQENNQPKSQRLTQRLKELEGQTLENELQKIKQELIKQHPEFKLPLELAELSGTLQQVIEFIETHLYDPILDRLVISRFDLEEHIRNNGFKRIFSFELKIKETNELLGYSYSDQLIKALWIEISKNPEINQLLKEGKIAVGRFGGTIFLGIKGDISKDTLEQLKNLTIQLNDGIEHIVGFAEIEPPEISDEMSEEQKEEIIKETIQKIFTLPSENWTERTIEFLVSLNEDVFKLFLEKLTDKAKITEEELEDDALREKLNLIIKYLTGKRGVIRTKGFIEKTLGIRDLNESIRNQSQIHQLLVKLGLFQLNPRKYLLYDKLAQLLEKLKE